MIVWDLWWSLARLVVYGLTLLVGLAAIGCQVDVGAGGIGGSIPGDEDVQYFAPGPQLPRTNEAAAQNQSRPETPPPPLPPPLSE